MKVIEALRRALRTTDSAAESLRALVSGCANQSDLLNRKFNEVIGGLDNQSNLLNRKLDQVTAGLDNQSDLFNRQLDRLTEGIAADNRVRSHSLADAPTPSSGAVTATPLSETIQPSPLLIAERT